MKEISLTVEGIMCGKCVKKVKEALLNKDSVENVNISDDFKTVTVLCDANKISAGQIGDIIEKIEDKNFKIIN